MLQILKNLLKNLSENWPGIIIDEMGCKWNGRMDEETVKKREIVAPVCVALFVECILISLYTIYFPFFFT